MAFVCQSIQQAYPGRVQNHGLKKLALVSEPAAGIFQGLAKATDARSKVSGVGVAFNLGYLEAKPAFHDQSSRSIKGRHPVEPVDKKLESSGGSPAQW